MIDVIAKLRELVPNFHGSDDDPKNWKSQWEVLNYLTESVPPNTRTLETGCGYSTVVFAASGASHTSVTPSAAEHDRVRKFCESIGVKYSGVTFELGASCEVLPQQSGPLDLVYIDGAHGFPHPCVDWMYTEDRLKVGGIMLIDDIRIPTCRMVHDFMKAEKNWELVRFIGDTAIYRKIDKSPNNAYWMLQNYNRSYPDYTFLPMRKRAIAEGRHLAETCAQKLGLTVPLKRLLGVRQR